MWNYELNFKLAQEIKGRYPDCKIIFGGPQISDTEKWLEENPFVDFAVFVEGEKQLQIFCFLFAMKRLFRLLKTYLTGAEKK